MPRAPWEGRFAMRLLWHSVAQDKARCYPAARNMETFAL